MLMLWNMTVCCSTEDGWLDFEMAVFRVTLEVNT